MSTRVAFDVLANSRATGFESTNAKILQQSAIAKKASEDSTKQAKLLSSALLAAGSAALPLGAAGVVALTGLGAAAGTAALAFLGLRKAAQQGSLQTTQFGKQLDILQGNLGKLETTAAAGVMPGLTSGLRDVNKLVPEVNRDVGVLSHQLGDIVGSVVPGVIAGFHQLTPAAETFGAQLVRGSKSFETWAQSSNQIRVFAGYAENQLPLAEQTLANVAVTGAHVVTALAPLGSTTVKAVDTFAAALRGIPVGALEAVVPIIAGGFIGKQLGAAAGGAGATDFAKKLSGIGTEGSRTSKILGGAAKIVGNLGVVGAVAGVALGGLSAVMGIGERNAARYRAQVDKVTQALQNGTTAQAAWVAAQNTGASAATKLGLSQQQITSQVIQGQKATETYTSVIGTLQAKRVQLEQQYNSDIQTQGNNTAALRADEQALRDNAAAIDVLVGKVSVAGRQYQQAQKQLAAWGKSTGDAALQAEITSGSYIQTSKSLGILSGTYLSAKAAADKQTESLKVQQAQMILNNDAAGLLSAALQGLAGNNLGVAQATTAVALANQQASKSIHDNGKAIKGNSAAALANQQALQGAASAAIQHAQAVAQQTGSSEKATAAINADKTALENNLRAQHALTPAIQAYIDKLFAIPPRRKTQLDVNSDAAAAKAQHFIDLLNSIQREIRVQITESVTQRTLQAQKFTRALGGPVTAGTTYVVGERGPELFTATQSGRIIPNARSGGIPVGGVTNVVINVHGGDPKAVVRVLEQYFGRGGTLNSHGRIR